MNSRRRMRLHRTPHTLFTNTHTSLISREVDDLAGSGRGCFRFLRGGVSPSGRPTARRSTARSGVLHALEAATPQFDEGVGAFVALAARVALDVGEADGAVAPRVRETRLARRREGLILVRAEDVLDDLGRVLRVVLDDCAATTVAAPRQPRERVPHRRQLARVVGFRLGAEKARATRVGLDGTIKFGDRRAGEPHDDAPARGLVAIPRHVAVPDAAPVSKDFVRRCVDVLAVVRALALVAFSLAGRRRRGRHDARPAEPRRWRGRGT
mmetsp:Transcript_25796/g.103025  ORF Transcript_25796/g.103025 Transcript_25796/m.103025 type:complete len:268 (-) Transcript_25796:284-1087(-)